MGLGASQRPNLLDPELIGDLKHLDNVEHDPVFIRNAQVTGAPNLTMFTNLLSEIRVSKNDWDRAAISKMITAAGNSTPREKAVDSSGRGV